MNKEFLLTESKQFCMLPWVHLFVTPKGDVFPCCSHSFQEPLGNVKNETLSTIYNSKDQKKLRLDMLNSVPNKICNFCYKFEDDGGKSARTWSNERFGTFFDEFVANTELDGSVKKCSLKYLDIRFNNICNFKCRTCGSEYSSQWAIEDYTRKKKQGIPINPDRDFTILEADPSGKLLEEVFTHLHQVDMIYFAGGEPMLSEEHYLMLEELIRLKKRNVLLRYNTNASTLKFKDKDILDLWKNFDRVEVSSSIDHYGERAEWLRHGTNWGEVESNLKLFRNTPFINFQINTVLSVFNYLTLDSFYDYMIRNDFYRDNDFYHSLINTTMPQHFSSTSLPRELKEIGTDKIKNFKNRLEGTNFLTLIQALELAQVHTNGTETWQENKTTFQDNIRSIDKIRGENMIEVFPELKLLMD